MSPSHAPAPAVAPAAFPRIPGYALSAVAGQGATATVYRARHGDTGRDVALKLLNPLTDDEQRQRFEREMRVAQALRHPDIVQTFEAGIADGRPWLALEWLPGHDLSRYVAPQRLLPERLVLVLLARLARALDHAHRQGVLHRDVKPGNIRIHLPAQRVTLTDFGIAGLEDGTRTATGVLQGTPAYMAPEQLAGEQASPATDLYALAVVGFELLTGRRPHMADNMGELLRSLARDDAPRLSTLRPGIAPELDDLMSAALSRRPARRPAPGEAWARTFEDVAGKL